jgi:3-hydroxy-9,10-secoandrosta-1,3,5(10)-triene-9,17-dione monooxygenase
VAIVDVSSELARGCGSTAWNWANWAVHHWMLALWPRQCQDEVWDADPAVLIASAIMFPPGKATHVPGGYRLTGRWPFSSGVDSSEWNMMGAVVEGSGELRMFVVPRADYRIIDNWHVLGLCGTGSKDVEMKDAFVPEHRTLAVDATKGGAGHPGAAANPAPLFRIRSSPPCRTCSRHSARHRAGRVRRVPRGLRTRVSRYSGKSLADMTALQIKAAEASACIDAARLVLRRGCNAAQAIAERGEVPDLLTKVTWRRDGAFCRTAVRSGDGCHLQVRPAPRGSTTGSLCSAPSATCTPRYAHITMMWMRRRRRSEGWPSDYPATIRPFEPGYNPM